MPTTLPADRATARRVEQRCCKAAMTSAEHKVFRDTVGLHRRSMLTEPVLGLTARDLELLRHAADGLTAAQVANLIDQSERRVMALYGRLYAQMGVPNKAAAVAKALRAGVMK